MNESKLLQQETKLKMKVRCTPLIMAGKSGCKGWMYVWLEEMPSLVDDELSTLLKLNAVT